MTGWLITWEWSGDHAKVDKSLITVLNYRRSGEYVRKFVEQLYAIDCYSDQEILDLARNKKIIHILRNLTKSKVSPGKAKLFVATILIFMLA